MGSGEGARVVGGRRRAKKKSRHRKVESKKVMMERKKEQWTQRIRRERGEKQKQLQSAWRRTEVEAMQEHRYG